MKKFRLLLSLFLVFCMIAAVTAGVSGDADISDIPESTATPEAVATEEPTATPEATEEPTATPEATEEPTATPEATEEPTAAPEATEEPTAAPEATEEPTATPEATAEPGGKITLNSKIEGTDGIAVVYQSEGNEDIATVLTLSEDGKTIALSTEAPLTDGVTYTAVVTCEGYITDRAEFTVTDGYYSFNITGFLPGDVDDDEDIDFFDFNNLCTKVADEYEPEDYPAFDLNKDGKINKTDISVLVDSWKVGGAK